MLWSVAQGAAQSAQGMVLSQDCQNVIGLAQSLKMGAGQLQTLRDRNCCGVVGVVCQGGRVDVIDWQAMGLNGTVSSHVAKLPITQLWLQANNIVGEIKELPRSIQYMSLENNQLSGKIPDLPNFYEAYLSNNMFSGKVPKLPSTAMYFYAGNNRLSGAVPDLPARMQYLDLQTNGLTGGLPVLPAGMVDVILANNDLKGKLPAKLPSTLQTLNLGTNAFFGSLPPMPEGMLELNLYNNDFTGPIAPLPKSLRVLNVYNCDFDGELVVERPVSLVANINHFTRITVKDQGQMVECDVSNNPVWRDSLGYLEGNCRLYGTKKPRPAALMKREVVQAESVMMNGAEAMLVAMMLSLVALGLF